MSKKNISLILSSLALLSAAGLQAEEAALDYSTLGTGEEIRGEVLPVANDDDYEDEDRQETDAQRRARLKREAEQRKNRNRNGNKETQGKCGEGTCS